MSGDKPPHTPESVAAKVVKALLKAQRGKEMARKTAPLEQRRLSADSSNHVDERPSQKNLERPSAEQKKAEDTCDTDETKRGILKRAHDDETANEARTCASKQQHRKYITANGVSATATLILGITAIYTLIIVALNDRAWVGPTYKVTIVQGLIPNRGMRVRINFQNTGKVPARDVWAFALIGFGDALTPPHPQTVNIPVIPECYDNKPKPETIVLFPGTDYYAIAETIPALNEQQVLDVVAHRKALYLVGCVQYWDGVHPIHPRYTHFCKEFVPNSYGPWGALGEFGYCPNGNDAD